MAFLFIFIALILGLIGVYLFQYAMIDKYDIYFSKGPHPERVTILEKDIFTVKIAYLYRSPEVINTLYFMMNYRRY